MNELSYKTYLAIETSCDETSVAIVRYTTRDIGQDFTVLAHTTLTQIDIHQPYGGVYPNIARREHEMNITAVLAQTLHKASLLQRTELSESEIFRITTICNDLLARESIGLPIVLDFLTTHSTPAIDGIIVTTGPGLAPALWVGVNVANTLGAVWNIPVLPANHMEGHIFSVFARGEIFTIPHVSFPTLALLISGGHTEIVLMKDWFDYTKIGQTVDDAIGEAFDKSARLMGLPYPGGVYINKLSTEWTPEISLLHPITFPRPMLHSPDYNFSFSGIKTAVKYHIDTLAKPLTEIQKISIAYEFQTAVTEVLIKKVSKAMKEYGIQTLIVGGGVIANSYIRSELEILCEKESIQIYLPEHSLSMDNALMIAIVGALQFQRKEIVTGVKHHIDASQTYN